MIFVKEFALPMRKTVALVCILIVAITALCSCDGSFDYTNICGDGFKEPTISPYKEQTLPAPNLQTYKVYIYGAVQNEGYYLISKGKTIGDAIALAGILPQTFLVQNATAYIQKDCQIALLYHENGTTYPLTNLNGLHIQSNLAVQNVESSVVDKLHAYFVAHGKIVNKDVLKQILTESEYQQNHYKFFVAEADYEAAS